MTLSRDVREVEVVPSTPKIVALQAMPGWERPHRWQENRVVGSQSAVCRRRISGPEEETPATQTPRGGPLELCLWFNWESYRLGDKLSKAPALQVGAGSKLPTTIAQRSFA